MLTDPDSSLLANALGAAVVDGLWSIDSLEPQRLELQGNERARRLTLWVDAILSGRSPGETLALTLCLQSQIWACAANWPPVHVAASLDAEVSAEGGTPLAYGLTDVAQRDDAFSDRSFWHRYLDPERLQGEMSAGSLPIVLQEGLIELLDQRLQVGTVAGALRFADTGPVGCFGPVESSALEHSGQPDLVIEATLLAEADDAQEQGGHATLHLSLYGDRHGAWLLHRRRLQPRKSRRNEAQVPPLYNCDVLVADSSSELIALAGLGHTEKALFRQAGVLPTRDLKDHYRRDEGREGMRDGGDLLTEVDPRSRRYLDAIVLLARDRSLSSTDLDALLRVARQMAKS